MAYAQELSEENKARAVDLARQGKALWQQGKRREAISAYEESAQIDPRGPGAVLLEHSRTIMDFFCKDFYNP